MNLIRSRWAKLGALIVLLGVALIMSGIFILTRAVPQTPRLSFPSLSYGIQAFLWWNPPTRTRDLERIRLLRFGYVKQIFDWEDVRPEKSRPYDWSHSDIVVAEANYRQIGVVARLGAAPYWAILPKTSDPNQAPYDLTAFHDYCYDLSSHYKGKIVGYQVWNEPNLAREWDGRPPNPAAYVKMLAACYSGIKAGDPAAIVISAPMAPTGNDDPTAMSDVKYLEGMYAAGLSDYYDVLGLNAPGYKSPPETSPDDPSLKGSRWFVFRHVEDMRKIMVDHGDKDRQIAILEVGWTRDMRDTIPGPDGKPVVNPYRWFGVTEQQQSDYLVGAYEYAAKNWRPWVGLMVTIYLPDPDWTPDREEYWWSIAEVGNVNIVKGAFINLSVSARYIGDKYYPPIPLGGNPYQPLPPMPTLTPTP